MYAHSVNLVPTGLIFVPMPVFLKLSIEEQLRSVLENPQQLPAVMQNLLKEQDASTACITFLDLLLKEMKNNPVVVAQCAFQFVGNLPIPIVATLIEEYPIVFVSFIECLNPKQKELAVKHVTKHVVEWRVLLKNVFLALDKTAPYVNCSPKEVPAGSFVDHLVTAFSPRRCRQWVKFCAVQLPPEDWAFFILCLGLESRKLALKTSFQFLAFDLTQEGYLPHIEILVQQMNFPNLVQVILSKILHKFYQQSQFQLILDQMSQLSPHAQVCLLDAMTRTKQVQTFQHFHNDLPLLASWMDGLFHHRCIYIVRKQILRRICDELEEGKIHEFLQILDDRNSQVGPYLMICLSQRDVLEFILTTPYRLRSQLLSKGSTDVTTLFLLRAFKNHSNRALIYENMTLDMENSIIPVDPEAPLTLKNCFETLQPAASSKDLASNFGPFIERIPPVLIGFLSTIPEQREVLLEFVSYMKEEQLKFLIIPISYNITCQVMKRIGPYLSPAQFIAILEAMSVNQLEHYVKFKMEQLRGCYTDFLSKYQTLQRAFELEEGELMTFDHFSDLQAQARALYLLARRPSATDCQHICRYFQFPLNIRRISEPLLIAYRQAMDNLSNQRRLFEGKDATISARLSELESLIIDPKEEMEEDLTTTLYQGFWTLVREGTLPYLGISPHSSLGITNAGQLNLFGIRSNDDLKHLGISQDFQNQCERLIQEVEELLMLPVAILQTENGAQAQKEIQQKFKILWQNFIDIKLEPNQIKPACKAVVNAFNLNMQDLDRIGNVCLRLCKQLAVLHHVDVSEREILSTGIANLEKCQDRELIVNLCTHLLKKALLILRGQYPLFCLQRYLLKNTNLKQTWEKFFLLECMTISQLFEKGFVQTSADLLQLEEVAKKI